MIAHPAVLIAPAVVDRATAPSSPPPLGNRPQATPRPDGEPGPAPASVPPEAAEPSPDSARLKAQLRDPALRVTSVKDEASGRVVLEVRDRASGEVVESYPPERLLRLFAAMRETLRHAGTADHAGLVDERA